METTSNRPTSRPSSSAPTLEELATEATRLLPPSATDNMDSSNAERDREEEQSSNDPSANLVPQGEGGDRAALLRETNNDHQATDTNTNTPTTENAEHVEDSIIINLTNRLRCLFACLTVPIFPLGICLIFLLLRLLYSAFVKDVSHTCSHPLKLYALLSFSLFFYFSQHKRIKMFLFGYQRDRDGPVRPRGVRIYDQLFHLLVLNYVYFGMLLVQSCKDDTPTGDGGVGGEDEVLISTCEATCPILYDATRAYVLILQVLVIVFLLPLVCLPFIYLWIVRRVTTEEAWARFGRVAAGEDAEEEGRSVTAKEILEKMNEVYLVKGVDGLVNVVRQGPGHGTDVEEGGTVSNVTNQSLEWQSVKDCCICLKEFDVCDDATDLAETPRTAPDKDIIVQTKCSHIFHKACIGGWIHGQWGEEEISGRSLNVRAARRGCPLCRGDLSPSVSTPAPSTATDEDIV